MKWKRTALVLAGILTLGAFSAESLAAEMSVDTPGEQEIQSDPSQPDSGSDNNIDSDPTAGEPSTALSISGVTLKADSLVYNGQDQTVEIDQVTAQSPDNPSGIVVPEEAYVIEEQTNKGKDAGDYTVKVTAREGSGYQGSAEASFTITPADLSAVTVTLAKPSCVYTGKPIKNPMASAMLDGVDVSKDVKITEYKNNTKPGTAFATVSASNSNFTNTKDVSFKITKAKLSSVKIVLTKTALVYTGKNITNGIKTATLNGVDVKKQVYIKSYKNNKKAGKATAIVAAKSNAYLTGTKNAAFTIKKANLKSVKVILAKSSASYTGKAVKNSIKSAKLGNVDVKSQVYIKSYKNNIKAGTATAVIAPKKSSNLTGSKNATYKITKASVSGIKVTLKKPSVVYTGKRIKNSIKTATLNGTNVKNQLYIKSYKNNRKAGTATAIIAPKKGANIKGTKTVTFRINKAKVKSVKIKLKKSSKPYTGNEIKNSIKSAMLGKVSVKNQLYIKSYKNNVNAGTATAVIEAKKGSNFTGRKKVKFKITRGKTTFDVYTSTSVLHVEDLKKQNESVKLSIKDLSEGSSEPVFHLEDVSNDMGQYVSLEKDDTVVVKKGCKACKIYVRVTSKQNENRKSRSKTIIISVK